jgi:glycogen(starch) synthase
MRVLTFGWDYPPTRNGGLGVACYGLTRELVAFGADVIFVLPKLQQTIGPVSFRFATTEERGKVYEINSSLVPYQNADAILESIIGYESDGTPIWIRRTLLEEVAHFANTATKIALSEEFHIIHAHDWTSYLAGVKAKLATGKPLVLHVHATSFDQAASTHVDPSIYAIEYEAFKIADSIVTVSEYTKQILIHRHHVSPEKIVVIHNGCDTTLPPKLEPALAALKAQGKRIVLYHGRITIQKGVDYFLRAARKVVDFDDSIIFVVSGWGDMTTQIIEQIGTSGLTGKVIYAGALWDEERDRMYQSADLVVMPSVSEPFGLVPLEAIQHGTPSLISKQSGVSEVLTHVLKVDFWDIDDMANQIIATMKYDTLRQQLKTEGRKEIEKLSWRHAAKKVHSLYISLMKHFRT